MAVFHSVSQVVTAVSSVTIVGFYLECRAFGVYKRREFPTRCVIISFSMKATERM
jgi:hypothetical protein